MAYESLIQDDKLFYRTVVLFFSLEKEEHRENWAMIGEGIQLPRSGAFTDLVGLLYSVPVLRIMQLLPQLEQDH